MPSSLSLRLEPVRELVREPVVLIASLYHEFYGRNRSLYIGHTANNRQLPCQLVKGSDEMKRLGIATIQNLLNIVKTALN